MRVKKELLKAILKRLYDMSVIPEGYYDEELILDTFETEEWTVD